MRRKLLAAIPALLAVPAVLAQGVPASFTVGDIRVEGLQRICEGTVFNYLPVNIGDRLDQRRVEEALRALYATGFFRDVELRRDGGTLVVAVLERPSIESFTIKGNKDIKTEDLEKSLRNVGLARGKTFNRVDARRGEALPHRPVLQPRQVRGEGRHQGRASCPTTASRSRSTSSRASARASARSTSSATRRSTTRNCSRCSS